MSAQHQYSCDTELCVHDVDICIAVAESVKHCNSDRGTLLRVLCNLLSTVFELVIVMFNYYVGQLPHDCLDLVWQELSMDCWFGSHAWERKKRQSTFV